MRAAKLRRTLAALAAAAALSGCATAVQRVDPGARLDLSGNPPIFPVGCAGEICESQRLPDGRLRYRIRTSAQWEIIPWVLSFGANAELVSPEAWRSTMKDTLSSLNSVYAGSEHDVPVTAET